MPEISRFYGIIIKMYFDDHNPPHIHIKYGEYDAIMYIQDCIIDGKIPSKVVKKVEEWVNLHNEQLLGHWELAQKGMKLEKIEPLK